MTRSISALAVGLLFTAASASASNTFGLTEVQGSRGQVELGAVVADCRAVVEIYDHHAGQQGRLLGSETVWAGANPSVRIQLAPFTSRLVLSVLVVDGQAVARRLVDMDH